MAKFRVRLDRDPAPFERLVRSLARQEVFQLTGVDYKRPKGESPSPLLSPWYNKKSLALECGRKLDGLLYSHDLVDTLLEGYDFLLPFYTYFSSLDGDPDPRMP